MKQQSGFTLIELIAVIVILGILAATALPKFVDLSDAAEDATVRGVAGALASGSALNHANNIAKDAGLTAPLPVPVATCPDVANTLDGGGLPSSDYVITVGLGTDPSNGGIGSQGGSSTCEIVYKGDKKAYFIGYGVTN